MDDNKANGAAGKGASSHEFHDTAAVSCLVQTGYKVSLLKCILLYPLAAVPLGLGLLLAYWFPCQWTVLTCYTCHLRSASLVIVKDKSGKRFVERVVGVELPTECISSEETVVHGFLDDNSSDSGSEVVRLLNNRFLKYFQHKHLRGEYESFVLLKGYDGDLSCAEVYDKLSCGLTTRQHQDRSLEFGPSSIDVPVMPYYVLFFKEVLHPFYIFQVFAVIVWFTSSYYYYAGAVVLISAVSVLVSLVQTRRHMQQLSEMMKSSCIVTVFRDGIMVKDVLSESLLPGDILVVPPSGMDMPCDAVLLSGQVIANEAMLTGESVPITKTPLPQDSNIYSPENYKAHTLFCGTRVIQTRFYRSTPVTAAVVRTGFSTAKGGIVRSILFPKPLNLKFYVDSIKFIMILSIIASIGFIYTLIYLLLKNYSVEKTLYRAIDLITIAIPPALPAALTVGTVYAVKRLRKQSIFCISPQRINLCGKIKLVCLDKTGTLTEETLDVLGAKPVQGRMFGPVFEDCSALPASSPLMQGMATCHSLTTIEGSLSGDPLDIKMFQATNWMFEEPSVGDIDRFDVAMPTIVRPPMRHACKEDWQFEIGILKQFTFSSALQRMGVITRKIPNSSPQLLDVFVKGAPETIDRLCIPDTVPSNFAEELAILTRQGYRVLALAHKCIHLPWHKAERAKRDSVECGLTFAGLLIMQNKLKEETTPVIRSLIAANIRPVMVTGDNILTAVCVARKCGMVETDSVVIEVKVSPTHGHAITYQLVGELTPNMSHENHTCLHLGGAVSSSLPFYQHNSLGTHSYHLAISGKSFARVCEHYPGLMEKLLVRGTVFARMTPHQKTKLVTALMQIGYGVAMCGDGANDCGALKAAHAGIALSETEASIASPFTSAVPNITCIPILIREGRAALVTSFSVFKFMALYSLTEFISASILYSDESNLGDFQYLFIDLILIFSIIFVMGLTGPYPELVRKRPSGTLAGLDVFVAILVQIGLVAAFQIGPLFYLKAQSWYVPLVSDPKSDNILCSENSVIFQVSNFQYIGLAVALSTAAPFRRPIYTNFAFMICLAILFPICVCFTVFPASWWPWFWRHIQIKPHPCISFRIGLVEIALVHCVIAFIFERFIFPSDLMHRLLRIVRCKKQPSNRYKHILASIPPDWPSSIDN